MEIYFCSIELPETTKATTFSTSCLFTWNLVAFHGTDALESALRVLPQLLVQYKALCLSLKEKQP